MRRPDLRQIVLAGEIPKHQIDLPVVYHHLLLVYFHSDCGQVALIENALDVLPYQAGLAHGIGPEHADFFLNRRRHCSAGSTRKDTLRLKARSRSAVPWLTGSAVPAPRVDSRSRGTPAALRVARVSLARSCESSVLRLSGPESSVWPTISMRTGFPVRRARSRSALISAAEPSTAFSSSSAMSARSGL